MEACFYAGKYNMYSNTTIQARITSSSYIANFRFSRSIQYPDRQITKDYRHQEICCPRLKGDEIADQYGTDSF